MTYQEAKKIIGNQPRWAIHNMILALTMCQWLNTSTEDKRLEACKIILKYENQKNEILDWINKSGYNER